MIQAEVYEGTAEEIAEQLRRSNLSGRLKAIVTPDEVFSRNETPYSPETTLIDFLAEVDQTDFQPGMPHRDPSEREVSRLIAAKFARQGHTK
jgi:hypothetical protein